MGGRRAKSKEIANRVKELRHVKASELIPNPSNWRTHPRHQADALRDLLGEIGIADALLARETPQGLMLIDGHLRADTAPDSIWPVLILDLNEDEADKLLLTLDPLAALATPDSARLDSLLREVQTNSEAVQAMLADLAKGAGLARKSLATEESLPDPPVDPITQPGDLWLLGEHRLLCGDSTIAEHVEALADGAKCSICFTSPPYLQQRSYSKEITDWDALMIGVFSNLPMAEDGQVFVNLGLVHREGEWIEYWHAWIKWMRSRAWRRFGWYVWDQGSGLPGDWNGRFAPSHEFVFHFNRTSVRPGKTVDKKSAVHFGGTNIRNKAGINAPMSSICLDSQKIPDSVVRINRYSCHGTGHPATFPIELPQFFLECWPGDVYEPFTGSGSTMIASEHTGRRCLGIELNPVYCDVAVARWERLTGRKAERKAGYVKLGHDKASPERAKPASGKGQGAKPRKVKNASGKV